MFVTHTSHYPGMLEYIEDMIGSNRLVPDIANASKKLDELNDVRQERLNRVKLVEKEKDNIEVLIGD